MLHWDELVKQSLLGTQHLPAEQINLPSSLGLTAKDLPHQDREDLFFKAAAVSLQYGQAGQQAAKPLALPQPAPPEAQPFTSAQAAAVARKLAQATSLPVGVWRRLWATWLHTVARRGLVASPELLPLLLQVAEQDASLRPWLPAVLGTRGRWLAQHNPAWAWASPLPSLPTETDEEGTPETPEPDEAWLTGKPEERLQWLTQVRQRDPVLAVAMIQAVWKQENANFRADVVRLLAVNLSAADEPFLQSIVTDKSQRVREAALALLLSLPDSAQVRQATEFVLACVQWKQEKKLLGLISKNTLEITPPASLPHALKALGVDPVSSQKGLSDGQYQLQQLIELVPPAAWEAHLAKKPEEIVKMLAEAPMKLYRAAFEEAVIRFRAADWARLMLQFVSHHIGLLAALPLSELNNTYHELLVSELKWVLDHLGSHPDGPDFAFTLPLSVKLLEGATAKHAYLYPELGLYLHPDTFAHNLTENLLANQQNQYFANNLRNLLQTLEQIVELRRLLAQL
ncbi:MAG: DUF5691 domain-containing protein [Bernardetiaceae bacterium]|nr:DUF5691 domain-containing protein [Bernardetiaceae bacterium]